MMVAAACPDYPTPSELIERAAEAHSLDRRTSFERHLFDAFADATEGMPRPQKDALWNTCRRLAPGFGR